MKISVRPIEKDEIKLVYELEKAIFHPIYYPQFVLKQFYDLMPKLFLVAVNASNEVLGYTQGGINVEKNEGWILSLATNEKYRRNGIGGQLSKKIVELLKSKGMKNILLTVHPANESAVNLYDRLGFKLNEAVDDYYGDGEPRLVMEMK